MKILGEETIKAIIIGIVGLIAIFTLQRVSLSVFAKKIPAKSGGTAIYLIYGKGDTFYGVRVNNDVVAAFHSKDEAEQFAKKVGGKVEVLSSR